MIYELRLENKNLVPSRFRPWRLKPVNDNAGGTPPYRSLAPFSATIEEDGRGQNSTLRRGCAVKTAPSDEASEVIPIIEPDNDPLRINSRS